MEGIDPMDNLRPVDPLATEWVTFALLALFLLLALINVSSARKWRLLADGMFRMRLGRQALREEMDLQDRAFLGLLVVAVAVLSIFTWQAFTVNQVQVVFPSLAMVVGGVVLAHYLLMRLVGVVLRISAGVEEYLYTGFLLFILSGILLLPIVVLLAYRSEWRAGLVMAGVVVVVLMVIFRWLRGGWIGLGEGMPLRYIILYFCAAELLPVLLVMDHWHSVLGTPFNQ